MKEPRSLISILGDPGAVSRAGLKGATKVFKHGRKSPWVPTLTGPFPNGQANAGSWLGTKMLCIIVPNRRTASPEFFSWVRTRRLLSRHSCPVRSPSFPNQKRRNYWWVENRFGCSAGRERYLAYSLAHNSVYLPKNTGSFQFSIQQHCWLGITVNIYFPLFWMM